MKEVKKTVYVTNDEIEFSTKENAIAYELQQLQSIDDESLLGAITSDPAEAIAILSQLLPEKQGKGHLVTKYKEKLSRALEAKKFTPEHDTETLARQNFAIRLYNELSEDLA